MIILSCLYQSEQDHNQERYFYHHFEKTTKLVQVVESRFFESTIPAIIFC